LQQAPHVALLHVYLVDNEPGLNLHCQSKPAKLQEWELILTSFSTG